MSGRLFGYIRVSVASDADANNLENQRRVLADCEQVFEDVGSGASWNRPGLNRLKAALQPGDCVKVAALDRLGRSLTEVLELLGWLRENGVEIVSLRESVDQDSAMGRAMLHLVSRASSLLMAEVLAVSVFSTWGCAADGRETRARVVRSLLFLGGAVVLGRIVAFARVIQRDRAAPRHSGAGQHFDAYGVVVAPADGLLVPVVLAALLDGLVLCAPIIRGLDLAWRKRHQVAAEAQDGPAAGALEGRVHPESDGAPAGGVG